jgi:hypothetical protein
MIDNPLVRVTAIHPIHNTTVWLRFSDDLSGEIDIADVLGSHFPASLRDAMAFNQLRLENGTPVWPDGTDISPFALHAHLRAAKGFPPKSNDDEGEQRRAQLRGMPEISRFFGIVIRMFYDDHSPPHFHVEHGEHWASITIEDDVISGRLPRTTLRLVLEWEDAHRAELLENWNRMRAGEPPQPIVPLV